MWGQNAGEWTKEHAAEPLGWMTLAAAPPAALILGAGALSGRAVEKRRRKAAEGVSAGLNQSEADAPANFEAVSLEGQKRLRRYKGDHRRYLSMDNIDEVVLHKPYEPRLVHGFFLKIDEHVEDNWPRWRDTAIDKTIAAGYVTAEGVATACKGVAAVARIARTAVEASTRTAWGTAKAALDATKSRYVQSRVARAEQQRQAEEAALAMPLSEFQSKVFAAPDNSPMPALDA